MFSLAIPNGIATANISGKNEKATKLIFIIKLNIPCKKLFPKNGNISIVVPPVKAAPIPSKIPIAASKATGNINVFPKLWKNSHTLILFLVVI